MSNKAWLILCSNLLYRIGQDFLNSSAMAYLLLKHYRFDYWTLNTFLNTMTCLNISGLMGSKGFHKYE